MLNLEDSDSGNDEEFKLHVNEKYAKSYERFRKNEELAKCK